MLFEHRYAGSSSVRQDSGATALAFAPDTLREPTYFRGRVAKQIEFREAISALHDVVISDLRFIPKDRTAYLQWREQQSYIDLAKVTADQARLAAEIEAASKELTSLERSSSARRSSFYTARQKYFDYLYNRDKELWFKLDPVITVHPDQVFFECFSRDESSYGRLAASYNVFEELGDRACGTTNIDYSEKLYGEFQKIRSYKTTTLDVDPDGFNVETSMEAQYREVKIDLPDSWVRGFLQVSSAATLPANVVELHPMDVHNLCLVLRRNKELFGPRSLRWKLTPGAPVSVAVEPWNHVVEMPRSRMTEGTGGEIRMWGRRRLHILERLLPRATRVRVFLLGTGLPTFWVVDMGELSFTLGLSGWTQNNWSEAGNFDLMAAREEVDDLTQQRVFAELGKSWLATPEELAQRTGLATPVVASALAGWVQAGRAIYDLDRGVYRKRELTREPLPMEKLRFANAREDAAAQLLHRGKIALDRVDTAEGLALTGRVLDPLHGRGKLSAVKLVFDADRRLVEGECSCDFYIRNRLHKGPCEHMLALRAAHRRGVNDVITFTAPAPSRGAPQPQPGATTLRDNFQTAYRAAITRAAELRAAGRVEDSLAELERIARLAPPDSDELGRVHEVIAESRFDAGQHEAARVAAERALARFPTSVLALRIKRDALVELDDVPSAIPVARALAHVDNKVNRWDELCVLCDSIADHHAMYQFSEEGLRLHPRNPILVGHRDRARANLPKDTPAPAVAEDTPARPSWWRRAVSAVTGRPATAAPPTLDSKLERIMGELTKGAVIRDREAVMQLLRVAHAGADRDEARVFALAAALKDSPFVTNLPSDQELLALLRRALA
jgi:tetratricopeptide (TPR) repeat protein